MKKSLIALAALATVATAAQAQSSVTIYGIIDVGMVRASGLTGDLSATTMTAPLATNRFGFRGSEDLGGGLKANFNLESGFNADTGAQSANTPLFNRQAWVGLERGDLGQIQLGRTTRLDFDALINGDAFGAANFGGVHGGGVTKAILGTDISSTDADATRAINSVKASTARFGGLSAALQYGFGEVAGDSKPNRFEAYSLDYVNGKLRVTYAGARQYHATTTAKLFSNNVLTASYDFGVAKAFAGYGVREVPGYTLDVKAKYVGVSVPVTSKVTLLGQVAKVDNFAAAGGTANADADSYSGGVLYAFSPRTTGYVLVAQINNDPSGTLNIRNGGTAGTGLDHKAVAVGVRHSF